MKIILDAAVFINATSFPFSKKEEYFLTSKCEAEIKENMAKLRLEAAVNAYNFTFMDPCPASVQAAQRLARQHGDARLSDADDSVLALALEFADRKEKVHVYTDDYSLQNLLKWRKIPFSGILHTEIKKPRSFKKSAKSGK